MIELDSVTYEVNGKNILSDISYKISAEKSLLIKGPSGCGKSTLMHIVAGLLKPTSGSVIFKGNDYSTLSNAELDRLRGDHFGFLFQRIHLIDHLTARQNIHLNSTKSIDIDIVSDLGIAHLLDQKASSLSVGEAQRIGLARALANNPCVIFADEPTSALDNQNADKVIDMLFLQAEKYQACLIVTSHDERIQSRFTNTLDISHDA